MPADFRVAKNRRFRSVMDAHDILTTDFPIPPTEPMLAEAVMPHMEAGDMLLFDTRTIRKLAMLSRFVALSVSLTRRITTAECGQALLACQAAVAATSGLL